jgi:mRNA-degrading endonuclease toxin of MazEF toxin-antitoxin module
LISFKTAKEKVWKSLEKAWKKLGKVWKRLGKVWNSLEKLARQASAHRDRGIGLALRGAGFAVSLSGGGLKTIGVVRCDQPRALDFSARRARLLERAPPEIVEEVLARLAPLFE